MAVAYDASSESHTGTTGSTSQASFSWNHTPSGTPKGILVFVFTNANAGDITSVTYGGVTMSAVSGGEAIDTAGEAGRCDAYFLGASIPTGTQSVVVNRTNNTDVMYAVAISVTAAADTETHGVVLLQNNQTLAEQSVDDGSPGTNSVRFAGLNSGLGAVPSAGASSTTIQSIDFGARVVSVVRETTAGQGSRSVGFSSATADDVAAVHLAVRETASPTQTSVAKISLASAGSPSAQTNHSINVRARIQSGAGELKLALYEGANNRSGDLTTGALTTSLADYNVAIADADAANITDYSNLDVWIWGYCAGGNAGVFEVDQVSLHLPASGATSVTLTPATETDSAQALSVTHTHYRTLGVAVETDGAQPLSITHTHFRDLTPATETDAAQGASAEKTVDLAPAAEADTAQALRTPKLTAATETDSAQAIAAGKSVTLAPNTETDQAQALSYEKAIQKALTPATETDAAQAASIEKTLVLGPAAEADTAQALSITHAGPQFFTLTPATETDGAQTLSFTKTIYKTIAPASEVDAAQSASFTKTIYKVLGPSAETDTAQALGFSQTGFRTIVPATETDTAQALSFTKTIYKALGPAVESDTAQALPARKSLVLTTSTEVDAPYVLTIKKTAALGPSVEVNAAQAVIAVKSALVSPATETDTAQALAIIGANDARDFAGALDPVSLASVDGPSPTDGGFDSARPGSLDGPSPTDSSFDIPTPPSTD